MNSGIDVLVYIYIYIYIIIYIYTYTYLPTYMHTYICIYVCVRVCIRLDFPTVDSNTPFSVVSGIPNIAFLFVAMTGGINHCYSYVLQFRVVLFLQFGLLQVITHLLASATI